MQYFGETQFIAPGRSPPSISLASSISSSMKLGGFDGPVLIHGGWHSSSIPANERAWITFWRLRVESSPLIEFLSRSSTARFRWGIPLTSNKKSSDSTDMSGFRSPASAKMLTTPSTPRLWRLSAGWRIPGLPPFSFHWAPSSGSPPVKGVDKTYQWGGAKVYHQRGHWPA